MMIARLRGIVEDAGTDGILVDVHGVGYPVQVSTATRAALTLNGEPATLLIETIIREDLIVYFGFAEKAEREWFRILTTVQGVGGKVALSILSILGPDQLADAIARQDKLSLARADGVGPKLAARLVTELKDKAGKWVIGSPPAATPARAAISALGATNERDAVAALIGLQFKPVEAERAVVLALSALGEAATANDLIRVALQELAR